MCRADNLLGAIVAFADRYGGVLVLGVEEGTKRVTGIRDVLAEEERLPARSTVLIRR